jgi:lambda repressor-like predicted transcriptional regulator
MKKIRSPERLKILALLKLHASGKGISMGGLAKQNNFSPSGLYNAFYGPFPKGENVIASLLGLRPQDIWPERFDFEGRRIRIKKCENKVKEENGAADQS